MEPHSMRSQCPTIVGGRCKGLWSSLHGGTHSTSIQEERMKEKITPAEESLGGSLTMKKDAQFVGVGVTSCSRTGLLLSDPCLMPRVKMQCSLAEAGKGPETWLESGVSTRPCNLVALYLSALLFLCSSSSRAVLSTGWRKWPLAILGLILPAQPPQWIGNSV